MHYQSTVADDCQGGFIGQNYETACSFPTYGFGCQTVCLCSRRNCNFSTGCPKAKTSNCLHIQIYSSMTCCIFIILEVIPSKLSAKITNHKKATEN